jgi:hypothetical protein
MSKPVTITAVLSKCEMKATREEKVKKVDSKEIVLAELLDFYLIFYKELLKGLVT